MKRKSIYWFILLALVPYACKEKYMPNVKSTLKGYLVVEGFINAGGGTTSIQLSRTTGLDSIYFHTEPGAQVSVQSDNGLDFPLTEQADGKYILDGFTADPSRQYRLHIHTSEGKDYLSEFSQAKTTPPIDSVSWKTTSDDLNIYVTTHDPQKNTLYYQWTYKETWIYRTPYESDYIYEHDSVKIRPYDQLLPQTCWGTDSSNRILVGSSAKLTDDLIYEFPMTSIPFTLNNKLFSRYSILVKQFALTKDWYDWKQKVKKNTEQLGTIFDPQPSETGGNFTCENDPSEPVIGFVGCTTETEKRIFIERAEIYNITQHIPSGFEDCGQVSIKNNPDSIGGLFDIGFWLITGIVPGPGPSHIDRVLGSAARCADCRLSGGSPDKPAFW